MKKNRLMSAILCLLALLALAGCKKNSGNSKSKMELLTQGTWKFVTAGPDTDLNGQVDPGADALEDCEKDNILTFSSNGTGTVDEGADVCAGEDQLSTFAWSFTNNETVVNVDVEMLGDVNILTLTETELKGYKDVTVAPGVVIRGLFVFNHP